MGDNWVERKWGDGMNIFQHFKIFNIKSLDSRINDIIFAARYESNNGI